MDLSRTILFTQKKIIKRPPLKVKKCLSNKTWVPLGPSILEPNGSGGGPLLGGWKNIGFTMTFTKNFTKDFTNDFTLDFTNDFNRILLGFH